VKRLALLALLAAGCSTGAQLVATDGSHRMKGFDPKSGLSVVLTTEAWDDAEVIEEEITVVHVLISNMGKEPILLAPGDFSLRDQRGFRYDLLDAGGVFTAVPEGTDPDTVQASGYDPGRTGDFRSIRSAVPSLSRSALPWGALQPGTHMRGFVYFERVTDAANHATLVWHAQTPDHKAVADFAFALHVARP
jgi:hypothetical protein